MSTLCENTLAQFMGSENQYRHVLVKGFHYTDGIQYVASAGEAYWLIDLIACAQLEKTVRQEQFQHWLLKVTGSSAVITADDGNGKKVFQQDIEYTNFSLESLSMYVCDGVLMLASEY